MKIALTGTPGTGKTTVASLLPYRVIDINALVRDGLALGTDPLRGCLEADMDGLAKRIEMMTEGSQSQVVILEGHFSHHFAPVAIVLRLSPSALGRRLQERGYAESKVKENLEAEALDVVLVEAVEIGCTVHELDATGKTPEEIAMMVIKIAEGLLSLPPGKVSWLEEMEFDLG
jgi:adenylate kinase